MLLHTTWERLAALLGRCCLYRTANILGSHSALSGFAGLPVIRNYLIRDATRQDNDGLLVVWHDSIALTGVTLLLALIL